MIILEVEQVGRIRATESIVYPDTCIGELDALSPGSIEIEGRVIIVRGIDIPPIKLEAFIHNDEVEALVYDTIAEAGYDVSKYELEIW